MADNFQILLKTALILPFVCVFFVTMSIILWFQQTSYESMLSNISEKRLNALTHAVDLELDHFLKEPFNAGYALSHAISFNSLYQPNDMQRIEQYMLESAEAIYNKIEHLDVIAFGSEVGDFVGFRKEANSGQTLMLQDSRTNQNLVIYRGKSISQDIRSTFEGYDPRTRPWYEPVAKSKSPKWSSIYANVDERKDVTLSALSPVYTQRKFSGVVVLDIKIDTFNSFLAEQQNLTDAFIYIFDSNQQLVAHSIQSSIFSESNRAKLSESPNAVIQGVSNKINTPNSMLENAPLSFDMVLNNERYFNHITPFNDENGLSWYIGVSISESNLLGALAETQENSLFAALAAGVIGLLLGFYLLHQVVLPIIWTAKAANNLAKGDWDCPLPKRGIIRETNVLLYSFQEMATHLQASFKALREQIVYDSLTKIYSRQGFAEKCDPLEPALGCLMIIGLDKFREVNDNLGHYHGDQILKIVAARLKSLFDGSNHYMARVGGDEFALFLHCECSEDVNRLNANRILQLFASPISTEGEQTLVHASIGMVNVNDQESMSMWLRKGSIALSHAKSSPTKISQYELQMDQASRQKMQLVPRIKDALDNNEFVPFYQPLIDLKTHQFTGAEALARWISPEHGLISPLEFISVAEEYDLINDIGLCILEKACSDTVKGIDEGKFPSNFQLHVNLSVKQLAMPDFVPTLESVIRKTRMNPVQLSLEITESKLIDSDHVTIRNMHAIRKLGIGIAIDDFGTGYSSLSYIHTLPFNCLKIDRVFIERMNADNAKHSLVKTIIDMSTTLGFEIIAEGIETEQQSQAITRLNCPLGQGFLFGKPVPYSEWSDEPLNAKRTAS
ncbi:bifunctional diguanylate cyclase/phosphodiesterase [Vibrio paucivorans]|uniref:EAL domain-containing protein n=1 Tax=Vibrio paucivorans TaxID=2829489 RepID=A0A9X3HRW0_9VIBR|nr:GGDEF and EAL domain-containing protein [Vibrio paucivorans]MCW8333717.1 EAL domain-containing protein [Vibrio paucivorans]